MKVLRTLCERCPPNHVPSGATFLEIFLKRESLCHHEFVLLIISAWCLCGMAAMEDGCVACPSGMQPNSAGTHCECKPDRYDRSFGLIFCFDRGWQGDPVYASTCNLHLRYVSTCIFDRFVRSCLSMQGGAFGGVPTGTFKSYPPYACTYMYWEISDRLLVFSLKNSSVELSAGNLCLPCPECVVCNGNGTVVSSQKIQASFLCF
jgi:hypothetical protein